MHHSLLKFSPQIDRDYYAVLGINRNATDVDIKKAYRNLALRYHPKRNPDLDTNQYFALVTEAYDVLSAPRWKEFYDQFGEEGIKNGIPLPPARNEPGRPIAVYVFHGDCMRVFREFFGVDSPFADCYLQNLDPMYKFFKTTAREIPGPDQELILKLTLEEAFYGCMKTVVIPLQVVDETGIKQIHEEKPFTFRIPRGTRNGHLFHFKAAGTSGPNMPAGDVTFKAEIQPTPKFWLEGFDIVTKKTVHLGHALTGCMIDVDTFDKKTYHISISDVIKPGDRITLKGEGLPIIGFGKRGDMLVELQVSFPEKLNKKQRDSLRKVLIQTYKETIRVA